MASIRVLTFNFHEPYLCLMAKTGLEFTVGLYARPPFAREWQTKFRPVPKNITFAQESVWRRDLEAGMFDVVVAHNELNAANLLSYDAPMILVCHNRRSFLETTVAGDREKGIREYRDLLAQLQEKFTFVFISESKRADYGVPGKVILPGIDVDEYGGYTGRIAQVLRVGNSMRARNLMFDVDFQEKVCEGIPNRVVGEDPSIPNAKPSSSFADLLHKFRTLRCLLHVTREDWEDGYNLSMLEAMACGMPVVSVANRTSPLTDCLDGFISYDTDVLHGRLQQLLNDTDLAKTLGARGRETVATKFPINSFVESWRAAIEEAAENSLRESVRRSPPEKTPESEQQEPPKGSRSLSRLRIALASSSRPGSVGERLECSLRRNHDVTKMEPSTPIAGIPASFLPQLYIWLDDGMLELPADLALLTCPKACYLTRTHVGLKERLSLSRRFDYIFVAHRGHVEDVARAGKSKAAWLPPGCSSEAHPKGQVERVHDVACVLAQDANGALDERQGSLMEAISKQFPKSKIGQFPREELAAIYAKCKVAVIESAGQGLTMQLFDAMAAGVLVVTDKAEGLDALFENGKHLAVYENEQQALDLVATYLKNPTLRDSVARAGAEAVWKDHTFDNRVDYMLSLMLETLGMLGGYQGESRFQRGGYYRAPRPELVPHIPPHVRRLLDVGCGGGEFGQLMKQRGVREVVGIELVERAWQVAKRNLDDALLGNIEEMDLPFADGYFDCICFADVLEHLVWPTNVLRKVSRILAPDGVVVMSIPNARFCHVIEMLAHGRWRYEDAGILDRTHLRFFTALEMQVMVRDAGLDVLRMGPLSMLQEEKLPRNPDGSITMGRMTFRPLDDADYQDLLTYQYIVVAGRRDADRLASARRALDEKNYEDAYEIAKHAQGISEFERACIMARSIARIGKLDTAESLYRKALSLDPNNPHVASELGILLVAMNRLSEARALLERAKPSEPGYDRALGALALVNLQEGHPEVAFGQLKESLEICFTNEALIGHLIATARQLSRTSEILAILRRFVDFYPGNVEMTYQYAELLSEHGQDAEARDRLETLLLLSPNHEAAQKLLRNIVEEP